MNRLRQTHTYATMGVAPQTYDDIRRRIVVLGLDYIQQYIHEFETPEEVIVLGSVGLVRNEKDLPSLPTGLYDSNGRMIHVGDWLKKETECNKELHGDYAIYEVLLQGLTPIISYVISATGDQLPRGYLRAPLCDEYDRKNFVFANHLERLTPSEGRIEVCLPGTHDVAPLP